MTVSAYVLGSYIAILDYKGGYRLHLDFESLDQSTTSHEMATGHWLSISRSSPTTEPTTLYLSFVWPRTTKTVIVPVEVPLGDSPCFGVWFDYGGHMRPGDEMTITLLSQDMKPIATQKQKLEMDMIDGYVQGCTALEPFPPNKIQYVTTETDSEEFISYVLARGWPGIVKYPIFQLRPPQVLPL